MCFFEEAVKHINFDRFMMLTTGGTEAPMRKRRLRSPSMKKKRKMGIDDHDQVIDLTDDMVAANAALANGNYLGLLHICSLWRRNKSPER